MLTPAILGVVRHVLTLGGGYLVARGTIDSSSADTLVGAGVSIAGVIWSIVDKRLRLG